MADPTLRLADAGHSYDGDAWQFRHLDFEVRPGTVTAILGPNGRGKSTLLRVLAGLLKLTEGALSAKGSIGFVPQDFSGAFPYSVLDIVLMGRARHVGLLRMPGIKDQQAAMKALTATGAADLADRAVDTLSGGQRQLVLIARALAGEHPTLLLDEPASALDLRNQDVVLGLVSRLAREEGLAVAFTTHQPNHALAVADRALLMTEGGALFDDTAAVMTDANLETLYGLPVRTLRFIENGVERTAVVPLFGCGGSLPSPPEDRP